MATTIAVVVLVAALTGGISGWTGPDYRRSWGRYLGSGNWEYRPSPTVRYYGDEAPWGTIRGSAPYQYQGASGGTGPRGYFGFPGRIGSSGRQGTMGESGPTGPKGSTGPSGYKSSDGRVGKAGNVGPGGGRTGATGGTGPSGTDGRTGSTGPPGPAARIPPAESRAVVTLELVWPACLTLALSVLTTFLLMRYRRVMDDLQDQRYNFRVQFVATSRVPSVATVASTDTQATEICDWNIPPQADGKSVKKEKMSPPL